MKEKNAKKSRDTANLRASWKAPGFNSIGIQDPFLITVNTLILLCRRFSNLCFYCKFNIIFEITVKTYFMITDTFNLNIE